MAPQQNQNQRQNPPEDFSLRETSPLLGGRQVLSNDRLSTAYDLVEQMQYLYVRVVKAKHLPEKDAGSCDPYVEVKLGNSKGTTKHFENNLNPEWNQVFAFSKDRIQSSVVEVVVKDKDLTVDDFVGRVLFDLNEAPKRVPPDSPLAPQWYKLENQRGEKIRGELMLSVWLGTQADEVFPDAWHSDAASVSSEAHASIRSKVYLSPKLWYLRVNVIEAQELVPKDRNRNPEVYVKAILGTLVMKSNVSQTKSINPMWNEDLMFVAAEPFEEQLILSVEDKVGNNKEEVLGKCMIHLQSVDRRLDHRPVGSRWYNLQRIVAAEGEQRSDGRFASKLHVRICLDGGYHVLDESTQYSSDLKPTAKQLWKPSIGILEVGILNANKLNAMKTKDGRGTTDAYCVAKYGQKWVRTRTIIDTLNPRWNEQYTWEVFDPCTVISIGVFDNCHLQGAATASDSRMGKVRIRLSTLNIDHLYTHSYPLVVLQDSGVRKMGEIQLAVRFSCSSWASWFNILQMYSQPLLPRMHYVQPLSIAQQDSLRHQATMIVSMRMSRAEPPLRKEAVEYMLDVGSHMWSMRRSRANFARIARVVSGLGEAARWFDETCKWTYPLNTILILILFLILLFYPQLILPSFFFYCFLIGLWNYCLRKPRNPPHMDIELSHADKVHKDDLDEEFDKFPTTKSADVVKRRYDRLRSIAGRIQTVMGDLATQGERVHSLLSWRDPRATGLFVFFCLVATIVFFVTPFKLVAGLTVVYVMRPPKFRINLPPPPLSFFRRLPARSDSML